MEKLYIKLKTIENDYFVFDIYYEDETIGDIEVMSIEDYYTIAVNLSDRFYALYRLIQDRACAYLINQLIKYITNEKLFDEEKHLILIDNEEYVIESYILNHSLIKLPRFCGYYIQKGE